MTDHMDGLDFAVAHDEPIRYRDRIGNYYQTLGYGKPYRWAQYADVPFTPLLATAMRNATLLSATAIRLPW